MITRRQSEAVLFLPAGGRNAGKIQVPVANDTLDPGSRLRSWEGMVHPSFDVGPVDVNVGKLGPERGGAGQSRGDMVDPGGNLVSLPESENFFFFVWG